MTKADILSWAIAAGVGAILLEIVRSRLQRRQMNADAAKTITDAATILLGPLHDRIKELEEQVKAAHTEADQLRRELLETRTELAETRGHVRKIAAEARQDRIDAEARQDRIDRDREH